ncbi:MAG TPA: nuclear transport factor 2 family protein [Candidatus Acidoferrum sp.]|jgi:ketosteroid isomerase-like protein|nr:nuclear transport factor 2 family protein [Candidatus Acidoferrum sp.]
MQRDIEKVEEIYAAHQRRDAESMLLHLAKDVEFTQSPELPWGGVYRGHEGVRRLLSAVAQYLDSRVLIERLVDAGDKVVAVGRTVGKARATQLEFDVPLVHVWTFHNGLVTRFESYIDNPTMLAVLGA